MRQVVKGMEEAVEEAKEKHEGKAPAWEMGLKQATN